MKPIEPELLDEIVRRLVAEFQPEQIILFGSRAWGNPRDESDLDLCVIVSHSDERPIERIRRAFRALSGLGLSKDILVKTRAEIERYRGVAASLERKILERGVLLYDGGKKMESQRVVSQSAL